MVTDQNHGYSVDVESVDNETADIIMTNINDGTVEGLKYKNSRHFQFSSRQKVMLTAVQDL